MNISVLILNYKTYAKSAQCLNSLLNQDDAFKSIIVIDNAEQNNDFRNLEKQYVDYNYVYFISTGKNLGYSKGNNYGYKWARKMGVLGDYVAVINNDIYITSNNTFKKLIKVLNDFPKAGAVSPKIIHRSTGILQGPYSKETALSLLFEALFPFIIPYRIRKEQEWRKGILSPIPVYRNMGSFILFRSSVFEEIHLFDENTFLGSEEEIVSEKLKIINRCFYYSPEVYVYHDHGASTSTRNKIEISREFLRSKLYYFSKYRNANKIELMLIRIAFILMEFWRNLVKR